MSYYQERLLFVDFDLDLVLKRTYTNPCEPQIPLKTFMSPFLVKVFMNPMIPGFSPEYPGFTAQSIQIYIPGDYFYV